MACGGGGLCKNDTHTVLGRCHIFLKLIGPRVGVQKRRRLDEDIPQLVRQVLVTDLTQSPVQLEFGVPSLCVARDDDVIDTNLNKGIVQRCQSTLGYSVATSTKPWEALPHARFADNHKESVCDARLPQGIVKTPTELPRAKGL